MHTAWVRFAATGDLGWTRFDASARKTMRFAETSVEVPDPWKRERQAMILD